MSNVKLAVSLYEPALPELTHKNVIDCFVDFGIPIPNSQNQFNEKLTRSQGKAKPIIPQGQGECPVCDDIVYVLKNGLPDTTKHRCTKKRCYH